MLTVLKNQNKKQILYRYMDKFSKKIVSDIEGFQIYYPKYIYLSINKKQKCLFSRRNGYSGKILFGYSIRLRLFKWDII